MRGQMIHSKSNVRPPPVPEARHLSGHLVDDLDLKILGILLRDGRASAREMGVALSVSTSTVTSRMARMRELKVLGDFTAVLDFRMLGYELTVVTEIQVSKGKLLEMEREIAKLAGVCAVYDVTGEVDAIVIAKCRTRDELSRYTKGLLAMPFVERTNSHVVLTTVKEDFRLPI